MKDRCCPHERFSTIKLSATKSSGICFDCGLTWTVTELRGYPPHYRTTRVPPKRNAKPKKGKL